MDYMEESVLENKIGKEVETLYEQYKDQIDNVRGVFKDAQGRSMTVFDEYALGKMLDNFKTYVHLIPEATAQNSLGRVLPYAMDIISSAYVTSIMPAIATIQPMDEIVGIVFFKALTAGTTRQGVTSGNTLMDSLGKRSWNTNASYSSNYISDETGDEAALADSAGDMVSAGTLNNTPVMKGSVSGWILDATDGATKLREWTDDSEGHLFGVGVEGTINYTTGAYTLTLHGSIADIDNAGNDTVHFAYDVDLEYDPTAVPKLTWNLTSDTVRCEQFMLEGQYGLITEFILQKRFGKAMDVELANDLKAEINAEVGATAIRKMYVAMNGNYNWSQTPPAGTSAYEHRMMFRDAISNGSNTIASNAGRGKVSYLVCGDTALTIIRSQPGYKSIQTGSEIGPHIAGMLDDVTVIKAQDPNLVPAAQMIAGYRGSNWFEAGVVYGPYLPLAVVGPNVIGSSLHKASGAIHVAAIHVVYPDFLTRITLT